MSRGRNPQGEGQQGAPRSSAAGSAGRLSHARLAAGSLRAWTGKPAPGRPLCRPLRLSPLWLFLSLDAGLVVLQRRPAAVVPAAIVDQGLASRAVDAAAPERRTV